MAAVESCIPLYMQSNMTWFDLDSIGLGVIQDLDILAAIIDVLV